VQRHGQLAVGEPLFEFTEVAAHDRPGVGLHHRGRGALVLAPLLGGLVRRRNGEIVAQFVQQDLAGPQFVSGILVAEQETDGHGAVTAVARCAGRCANRLLVKRCQFRAVGCDAAGNAEHVPSAHQGRRLAVVQIVQTGPWAPGDVISVLHPGGCQQEHRHTTPLEKGVEPLRRAVHQESDVGRILDDSVEAGQHPFAEVAGRCRRFACGEHAGVVVIGHHIGESATNVHRNSVSRHGSPIDVDWSARQPMGAVRRAGVRAA